jgi:hypothetical protein
MGRRLTPMNTDKKNALVLSVFIGVHRRLICFFEVTRTLLPETSAASAPSALSGFDFDFRFPPRLSVSAVKIKPRKFVIRSYFWRISPRSAKL